MKLVGCSRGCMSDDAECPKIVADEPVASAAFFQDTLHIRKLFSTVFFAPTPQKNGDRGSVLGKLQENIGKN